MLRCGQTEIRMRFAHGSYRLRGATQANMVHCPNIYSLVLLAIWGLDHNFLCLTYSNDAKKGQYSPVRHFSDTPESVL